MSLMNEWLERTPVETSAPCRIDMGGTLDLSTFYLSLHLLKPCTFNVALDLRTRVRLEKYDRGRIKISSRGFDSLDVDSRQAPFNHPLGLMLAVAAYFDADGVHIQIESASPVRSALGGSSVAAVALVWAFHKAMADSSGRHMPEPGHAALLAHEIEQSVAGVPCGRQDQLAAAFGGVNVWHWLADPAGPCYERQVIAPRIGVHPFSECLLLAYCGQPHASKDINGTWVRDFLAGRYRPLWRDIALLSREFVLAITAADVERAQKAMNTETDLRCRMTPQVLDDVGTILVNLARDNGCGARFTGAGGGGCLWALGEPDQIQRLTPIWRQVLDQHDQAGILDTAVDSQGIL